VAEERKSCAAVHLAHDHLGLGADSLGAAVVVRSCGCRKSCHAVDLVFSPGPGRASLASGCAGAMRSGTLTRSSASHPPAVFVAHRSPRPWRDRTRRAGQASRTHAAPRGKRVVATRAAPVGQRAARSAAAVRAVSSSRRRGASMSTGMPGRVSVRSRTGLDCIGCLPSGRAYTTRPPPCPM
jgi:hypothetical protein